MALKVAVKTKNRRKKPREIKLPPLPIHEPLLLRGTCECEGGAIAVRLGYHARVDMQMVTARCRTCEKTFYLTERG